MSELPLEAIAEFGILATLVVLLVTHYVKRDDRYTADEIKAREEERKERQIERQRMHEITMKQLRVSEATLGFVSTWQITCLADSELRRMANTTDDPVIAAKLREIYEENLTMARKVYAEAHQGTFGN